MIWTSPVFLVVGAGVALLLAVGQVSRARRRRLLGDLLGGPRAGWRLSRSSLYRFPFERVGALAVAALAIGAAAADPRRPAEEAPEAPEPRVRSFVLAIDVSASMQARDAEPNRLARSRAIAEDIIAELEHDRVGLTIFAGEAYPLVPPTYDHAALLYLLSGVTPTIASAHDPGSLLSVGIRSAAALLLAEGEPDGDRTIVVIGDGEAGEPDAQVVATAAEMAALGITIHTIGVGTPQGAGMTMPQAPYQLGGRIVDARGAPVVSHLQEATLERLASTGGGRHVSAADESAVEDLIGDLSVAPEAETPTPLGEETPSLWDRYEPTVWLIVAALFLIVLESLADVRIPWTRPSGAGGRA